MPAARTLPAKTPTRSRGLLGLETLEGAHIDVLHQAVELLLRLVVLVSLSRDSHAHLARHVPDALLPDVPVKSGLNADILARKASVSHAGGANMASAVYADVRTLLPATYLGVHLLGGETLDVADGTRSSLLELNALESLVHVEGVVAARGLQLSFLSHLY